MTKHLPDVLVKWHDMMDRNDMSGLRNLLAEDAVFHSPVVHSPQKGRDLVLLYLNSAGEVFNNTNFQYLREVVDENNAVLEFSCEMEGIAVNGIDMISWNDEGQITDFKVMVRPLKAINMVWKRMGEMLEQQKTNKA